MLAEKRETPPLIFMLRLASYVHRGIGQAPAFSMYARRWLSLRSRVQAFKGGIDVLAAILHSIRILMEPLSCWRHSRTEEVISPSATSTEFDTACTLAHPAKCSTPVYFVGCTVVQESVLVDYCCFHLLSGAFIAGSFIVHRNRKRLILSQSTVREEFIEKEYQVFDIIGRLLIVVQVNPSSPVDRV